MGRPLTFGALTERWSDDSMSSDLIHQWTPYVLMKARIMDQLYPGEDWEAAYSTALYNAVFKRDDRRCSFKFWLQMKIQDQGANLRQKFRRRPAHWRRISYAKVDEQLYYRDQHKDD